MSFKFKFSPHLGKNEKMGVKKSESGKLRHVKIIGNSNYLQGI